jgi:hypothetical protein
MSMRNSLVLCGLVAACSIVGVGADRFVGAAFAVMGESAPAPAPAEERSVTKFDLPVTWQLTRSKLMGPGATTLTESFRETWTLELNATGRVFLQSPRARVPAFASGETPAPADKPVTLPHTLVLSERDLARLVGIKPGADADDEAEAIAEPVGRPVTLILQASAKNGLDVSLAWSEEEHFAVHLDIGSSTVF